MNSIQQYNPQTLPQNDNINDYSYNITLQNDHFMVSHGAMIAYYGQLTFSAIANASMAGWAASFFSSPLYAQDWMVAQGVGQLILGANGRNIASYDLTDNGSLTIRAASLLAFAPSLQLTESVTPGFVNLTGDGKFLASSHGPVIFAEPPVRIDPQALLGWADCPTPSIYHDINWMTNMLGGIHSMFGTRSGEEAQLNFVGEGTLLVQSNELVIADKATVALIEQQLNMLDQQGLTRIQASLQSRIASA